MREITSHLAQEAFSAAFGRYVGPGKLHGIRACAEQTDINIRTVRAWHGGETTPGLAHFLRLCAYIGPAFTSEVLELAGQGGVEDTDATPDDGPGVLAEMCLLSGQLAHDLKDQNHTHREKRTIAPDMLKLAPMLEATGKQWKEAGNLQSVA